MALAAVDEAIVQILIAMDKPDVKYWDVKKLQCRSFTIRVFWAVEDFELHNILLGCRG